MKKNKQIAKQNSFTEFLLYTTPNGKVKVEIFLRDENIWLTQAKIAELFYIERSVITKHLKNIFEAVNCKKMQYVQFLHILPRMARPIKQSFIISMLSYLSAIG